MTTTMTNEEIIRMAREAGIDEWETGSEGARTASQTRRFTRLKLFAALVEQQVRSEIALEALTKQAQEQGEYK